MTIDCMLIIGFISLIPVVVVHNYYAIPITHLGILTSETEISKQIEYIISMSEFMGKLLAIVVLFLAMYIMATDACGVRGRRP